jgi:hypothetical protein
VFRGALDFVYPHLDEASRTLAVRFHIPNQGHRLKPGMYATVTIDAPPHRVGPLFRPSAEDGVALSAADAVAHALAPGGVGPGLPALLYAAGRRAPLLAGRAPAVPDSAVIDTGGLKVVYREASPGVFQGVAVELGPRMAAPGDPTAYYPVLRGLEVGERVVTNGSFLLDAQTRLNPAAGSIYFGGGKGASSSVAVRPSTPESDDALDRKARAELGRLGAADRRLADAQKFCPVQRKNQLGSMGPPFKTTIDGQTVFLCCGSCEEKARADPKKTLAVVEELKKANAAPQATGPVKLSPEASEEAEIRANLGRLPKADRPLAEAQKYCPTTGDRLGTMGEPVKVLVKDQPVFLCCKVCEKKALADPDKTLAKVNELKAKAESHKHD